MAQTMAQKQVPPFFLDWPPRWGSQIEPCGVAGSLRVRLVEDQPALPKKGTVQREFSLGKAGLTVKTGAEPSLRWRSEAFLLAGQPGRQALAHANRFRSKAASR